MTVALNDNPLTVTNFMKLGISLGQLDALGQLGYETKYLQALCDLGMSINLISYAGRDEQDFVTRSTDIQLLCNSMGLPDRTYMRRLHQLHAIPILRSHVIRTMNVHGMRPALRAHWAWGTPVVCRSDYLWSTGLKTYPETQPSLLREAYDFERQIFSKATHISTATELLAKEIEDRAPSASGKTTIIPNYVDCELFQPMESEKRYDLVYVGYLIHVKNLEATLEAVERAGASIAIIGGMRMDEKGVPVEREVEAGLKARFGGNDRIHWLGIMPNEELPAYINQARALILCSLSEGFGRVIVEAMACGIPVIGSNLGGPKSLIRHGETGWLCETDADSIADAIEAVLSQPRLIEKMGRNARQFALENFSLPAVARQEYDLLADVARRYPVDGIAKRVANYVMRRR